MSQKTKGGQFVQQKIQASTLRKRGKTSTQGGERKGTGPEQKKPYPYRVNGKRVTFGAAGGAKVERGIKKKAL